jgi:type II secretory pathway pseudopilin PulG
MTGGQQTRRGPGLGPQRGFTMLEIMISLVILFGALGLFLGSVSQARSQVDNAKALSIATNLARLKMVELEAHVRDDGFGLNDDEEDEGDFEDFEYTAKKWTWKSKIEKVELPPAQELTEAAQGSDLAGGGSGSGSGSAAGGTGAAGGGMGMLGMLGQVDMVKNVLEQSIRRVTLEVNYPMRGGDGKGRLIVVAYFTDPKVVDATIQVPTPK